MKPDKKGEKKKKPRLNSRRTADTWETDCCEFKKVAGIPNLRFSATI